MRVLFVHPSPLFYSELYLKLEPLGLELVVAVNIIADPAKGERLYIHASAPVLASVAP